MTRHSALFACVLAGSTLTAGMTFAAGTEPADTPSCPKGKVFDKKKQACTEAKSGLVDDTSLADYAYALAKAKRYDEALTVLNLLKNPNTAEALNYRGYATRKLGQIDEGIGYYLQAVNKNPEYTLVREYLGEAYVLQGKIDLARDQLGEIRKRCGTTCEEYEDLDQAITTGRVES